MHFPKFTVVMHTFLLFRFGRHSSVSGGLCMIQYTPKFVWGASIHGTIIVSVGPSQLDGIMIVSDGEPPIRSFTWRAFVVISRCVCRHNKMMTTWRLCVLGYMQQSCWRGVRASPIHVVNKKLRNYLWLPNERVLEALFNVYQPNFKPCSEQKIAQFRTHYLTKERSYVSTQSSGQFNTFILNHFSVHWKVAWLLSTHVPLLSSGCEIAQFLVRHTEPKSSTGALEKCFEKAFRMVANIGWLVRPSEMHIIGSDPRN